MFKVGEAIRNRRGRDGVVLVDAGGLDVLIRYNDGKRDVWVQRQNIEHVESTQ